MAIDYVGRIHPLLTSRWPQGLTAVPPAFSALVGNSVLVTVLLTLPAAVAVVADAYTRVLAAHVARTERQALQELHAAYAAAMVEHVRTSTDPGPAAAMLAEFLSTGPDRK